MWWEIENERRRKWERRVCGNIWSECGEWCERFSRSQSLKVANHKDLFISCVDKIFDRWIKGLYKSEVQVIEAIQCTLDKNLSLEEGYTVYVTSQIGESLHAEL